MDTQTHTSTILTPWVHWWWCRLPSQSPTLWPTLPPKVTNLTHTAFCTWFNSASLTWDSSSVHKWSVQSLLRNDKHNLQAIGIIKRACVLLCLSGKCVHLCWLSYNPKLPLVTTAKNKTLHRTFTDNHALLSKQAHEPFCPSPRSPWELLPLLSPHLIPSCIYKPFLVSP